MPGLKKKVSRKKTARKRDPAAALRKHLVKLLNGGEAHVTVALALADFPAEKRGAFASGLEHTGWQLLEHIRIAQWDLLEFSRNPRHTSPEFPDGYWPLQPAPGDDRAWAKSVQAILSDLRAMTRLLEDPRADLFAAFPWGNGETLLREALVLADHTAYHLGQMVDLRRALGIWKKS
jgi:DinB superfamily